MDETGKTGRARGPVRPARAPALAGPAARVSRRGRRRCCRAAPTSTPTPRCSASADEEPQSQQGLARMCGVSGTTMTAVGRGAAARRASWSGSATPRTGAPTPSRVRRPAGPPYAGGRRTSDELEERLTAAFTPRRGRARLRAAARSAGRRRARRAHARRRCATAPASWSAARAPADAPRVPHRARAARHRAAPLRHACAPCAPPAPSTQGQLAALLDVSPATVVQIVDHLEARGLVARERDPDDRRAYRLHLPPPDARSSPRRRRSPTILHGGLGGPGSREPASTWSGCCRSSSRRPSTPESYRFRPVRGRTLNSPTPGARSSTDRASDYGSEG